MTDERGDQDGKRTAPPEGVRIIGAEEAAEALERGDVAQRRTGDELRYGDRPPAPTTDGPRPVLRFPLGSSSDARDIERPAVAPSDPVSEQVELPHWTEPATGQVPQILPEQPGQPGQPASESDDWTSFATSTPRWRDDARSFDGAEGFDDMAAWAEAEDDAPMGALDDRERPTHDDYFTFADLDDDATAGARSVFADDRGFPDDWADDTATDAAVDESAVVPPAPRRRRATGSPVAASGDHRAQRAAGPQRGGGDRNMGQALVVGLVLLGVALVLFWMGPTAAMVLVTAVIALASAELFGVLRRAGYTPLPIAGIVGSVGLVLGAYNNGTAILPAILVLTTAVCLLYYLVGAADETPVMNVGVTMLGVLWVGLFGSFAALMLGLGDPGVGLLLAAVLGTIGYDVGGYVVGKNAGSKRLSAVSPNKTVEGLIGGMVVATLLVALLAAVFGFGPVDGLKEGLLVGLVIALAAPLGDLCESLIKRDLGVKDMGSILPGHGGVLDRFDAMLFVLPAVYLLATVRDFFL